MGRSGSSPTFSKMAASEKGIVLKSPDGATPKLLSKGQRGRDGFNRRRLPLKQAAIRI